ncbi:hypothetical protein AB0K43_20870 [Kitasatospora sp. NPDC049258]|uniref:hypothetical protein n=1 Tax=Kitasatospora sp. NPDC049258 TaxID=3155394 RepID=UPI00343D328E
MTTAQELFAEGMREHFAPAVRALGLIGCGLSFTLPDEECWALLGVQLAGADERAVRYTLNLGITPKARWGGRALRPDPNTVTGLEIWRAGIGELMPVGEQVWWEVAPGPRWQVAVQDSVAAVRHHGLPELLRRLDGPAAAPYLTPAELEAVNAALAQAAVARIKRAELLGPALVLTGAWSRADPVAREVLAGAARGFLSAGDDRFDRVRCLDTLGRELWLFDTPGPPPAEPEEARRPS